MLWKRTRWEEEDENTSYNQFWCYFYINSGPRIRFIQIVNMCCPFINKKHLCSSTIVKYFRVDLVHYKLIRVLSGWNLYSTVCAHDILALLFTGMQAYECSWQKAFHSMKFDFYSMIKQCAVVSIDSFQSATLRLWIHGESNRCTITAKCINTHGQKMNSLTVSDMSINDIPYWNSSSQLRIYMVYMYIFNVQERQTILKNVARTFGKKRSK